MYIQTKSNLFALLKEGDSQRLYNNNFWHLKDNCRYKSLFTAHQRLHVENPVYKTKNKTVKTDNFKDWLVGITDGDGCFSFSVNKSSKEKIPIWNCTFKIAQSKYNLRLLHYIKKNLGIGKINDKSGKSMAEYRIRDRKMLYKYIIPIFDKHPLYSTKQFYYLRWKKALQILENKNYTLFEKNKQLSLLKQETPKDSYISPTWEKENPSDSWVYGFTEAEGSFFLTLKGETSSLSGGKQRIVHSFGFTQKYDYTILQFLRTKFHIPAKVTPKGDFIYKLETSSFRSLQKIKIFFCKKLKGMKSVEYRIWARSFKDKSIFEKLLKVQSQMRLLKQKDPSFSFEGNAKHRSAYFVGAKQEKGEDF